MEKQIAYSVENRKRGNAWSPHIIVRCALPSCKTSMEFPAHTGEPPQIVAKKIRKKGWQFRLRNSHETRCPNCIIAIKREEAIQEKGHHRALWQARPGEDVLTVPNRRKFGILITTDHSLSEILSHLEKLGDVRVVSNVEVHSNPQKAAPIRERRVH